MIRTGLIKILMWAIIPIALTIIFFVTVDYEKSGMWICLFFVWLAYLTVFFTSFSRWGKHLSVLNWTLYLSAIGYFVVELVVAAYFLYINVDDPQWSFAVQLLLFVAYVLLFGLTYIANRKTNRQIQEFCINDTRVKQWRAKVALMQSVNPSKELKELSDLLSITPIMSTQEVYSLDEEISRLIETATLNITVIIDKIKERNIILKYNQL